MAGVLLLIGVASQFMVAVSAFNAMMKETNTLPTYPGHVQSGLINPCRILFGLQEGYNTSAVIHNLTHVQDLIDGWMTQRIMKEQPVVSGALRS